MIRLRLPMWGVDVSTSVPARLRACASVRPCVRASVRLCAVVAAVSGCARFNPASYAGPETLFRASMRQFRSGRFDRSLMGFQRLALELSPRDTLYPLTRFYLAESFFGQRDYVTAAREFRRVSDEAPEFRLAPHALLRAGDAYLQLWKRPELDPANGQTAMATYQELLGRFPDSEAAAVAQVRVRALNDEFALKDYQNALFYYRRGAYESAILYLRQLIAAFPSARVVPDAFVRLVRAYRAIGYREEEQETCAHLRQYYGVRRDVRELCGDGSLRR